MSDKGPAPPTSSFEPPSLFDIVKELNAHAGRLATMLGLIFAGASLSLTTGPLRDALAAKSSEHLLTVYAPLMLFGSYLAFALWWIVEAMEPAVPSQINVEADWVDLIAAKTRYVDEALKTMFLALLSLGWAWFQVGMTPSWVVALLDLFLYVILAVYLVRLGWGAFRAARLGRLRRKRPSPPSRV